MTSVKNDKYNGLHTVPDAFMVSLAHCHSKRGSRRAERPYVKWKERKKAGPACSAETGSRDWRKLPKWTVFVQYLEAVYQRYKM